MTDAIRAADSARAAYSSARNCAESVLSAIQAEVDLPGVPEAAGSGFTMGIGNTGCVCGALAGGVMMLGAFAETENLAPEARRLRAEALSAEFFERFKQRWGATCCRVIKRGQEEGSREWATHCAGITEYAAALALEIIDRERGAAVRKYGPRDVSAMAERLAVGTIAGWTIGELAALVVALVGATAPWLGGAGAATGLVVSALGERGTAPLRRGRRALAALGLLSAAAAMVAVAVGGATASREVAGVLAAPGVLPAAGRLLVAIALLAVAGVKTYEFGRYR